MIIVVSGIGGELVKLNWLATAVLIFISSRVITITSTSAIPVAHQTASLASSDAIPTLPAHYVFTWNITLTNTQNVPAYDVKADVVLLPPQTSYSRVTLTGESMQPIAWRHDLYGNLVGTFFWSTLRPHQTVHLTLHYSDTSYDVSYKLPKTYPPYNRASRTYQIYTSPRLEAAEVNTDSPVLLRIVHQVVKPGQNPEQAARALFIWIVKNIRYNPTLRPSGSAVATAEKHLGICSDIADLFVGLLRTDHIPARFIAGYVSRLLGQKMLVKVRTRRNSGFGI